MFRISTTTRIALCLAIMALNVMLVAQSLRFFPDEQQAKLHGRTSLCEAVAITCSLQAARGDLRGMESALRGLLLRNEDILSAAVRDREGHVVVRAGEHEKHWRAVGDAGASDVNIFVPIIAANRTWGRVEVAFGKPTTVLLYGVRITSFVQFAIVVTCLNSLVFLYTLRRFLRQLDPSRVVPDRVRSTLDTLAEGVLVLDSEGRIVLANDAFSRTVGSEGGELQGRSAAELPWGGQPAKDELPWHKALAENKLLTGVTLTLESGPEQRRTFMVNSAPILDDRGELRGVLATFDDITPLEKKTAELVEMLSALRRSREEIQRQNEQLRIMATQDSLTGCLNRRAFFEEFATAWDRLERGTGVLSCMMIDIDHFKSINDEHGHSRGDDVLRAVSGLARESIGTAGFVCRFGGEEFCVLLPAIDLDGACAMAERLRQQIQLLEFPDLRVTASLGVSSSSLSPANSQELLDQADKSLYIAKRGGRNQVVRWDQAPADVNYEEKIPRQRRVEEERASVSIPFHAVTALMSALAYRDDDTAAHSARVADLCVRTARGLLTISEIHVLEVAALLHDIGKIGVPDAILLKPGKLTDEEWRVMRLHDRIGVEIINAAFACEPLREIIATHHAKFGGAADAPCLPSGKVIPMGARILAIADSFDAMVSDRVYRKGRSFEAAFAELRRCAGTQFDPEIVEHFIRAVREGSATEAELLQDASRQTGLHVGMQIERLAEAVDKQDLEALVSLAGRLEAIAAKHDLHDVHEIAQQLRESSTEGSDLADVVRLTLELMDLCRSTHSFAPRSELRQINDVRRQLVTSGALAAEA